MKSVLDESHIVCKYLMSLYDASFDMQVNDIYHADTCKIVPAKFSGSKEIVSLHFRKLVSDFNMHINYQDLDFNLNRHCKNLLLMLTECGVHNCGFGYMSTFNSLHY